MTLTEYKRKRRFDKTPEPPAKVGGAKGFSYVIQKHAASHLHYDFRLELDGMLLSWAVPKGPCLDPSVKRLAMHVEDHPVRYGEFEGIIPEGEYGGGTVMLWDRGTWEPIGDPRSSYRQGKLEFRLAGEKLQGEWKLIRTRSPRPAGKEQWLLMKRPDDVAKSLANYDILSKKPKSVVSGRSLEEIASDQDRVWTSRSKRISSKKPVRHASRSVVKPKRKAVEAIAIKGASKTKLPTRIEVQLATLTKEAPTGDQWLHEIKFDGYRMICRKDGAKVKFISRNHQDWTKRLSTLVSAVQEIDATSAILDGEVVVMNASGVSDFQSLQNAFREGNTTELQYYVFDVLYLNGARLTDLPLAQRKEALSELCAQLPATTPIHYSEHVIGAGEAFKKLACQHHLEGSISKRRDQPYRPGRGTDWLKVKCGHNEEFVIGGFTAPRGSRAGFGALLLGCYDDRHRLHYAGKVGTGFGESDLKELYPQLQSVEQKASPFSDRLTKTGVLRTAHWVKPKFVAQISFGSRTRDGILRHSAFEGLREDKPPDEVKLDKAMPIEKASKLKPAKRQTSRKTMNTHARRTKPNASESAKPAMLDPGEFSVAGIHLTHPDKLLFPGTSITKRELAAYYRDVAEWMLPHIVHRPLVLVRCPEGQGKACFYQKHPGLGTPEALRRIPIRESTKTEDYVIVDDLPALVSLAQMGALEIHAWGAREDKLEQPDRLIFDLDPGPEVEWKLVVHSARQIRKFLQELGLETFVKTTGGKGLHLVAPIRRNQNWDEAKAFCKAVAGMIVAASPEFYLATMSKANRTSKIFVDYLRNGRGATAVVPYSPRARPNAPISTPLTWQELSPKIASDHFTISNVRKRLNSLSKDPWEGFDQLRQSLTGPLKAVRSLSG